MTLTFGSLFAGIGGFDLGLERAGMVCKWQVEIDDYATKVLEKHWPDTTRFRDVRNCGQHNLEPVDIVCGGFPCQDISGANPNAKGISGERSGLWFQFARIIRELEPRWVVAENVKRLLSINAGWDFGEVLRTLDASGYDVEWDVLPAAAFGAPHIRERVILVAHAIGGSVQSERKSRLVVRTSSTNEGETQQRERGRYAASSSSEDVRNPPGEGLQDWSTFAMGKPGTIPKLERSDWWTVEPAVGRVAHGVPHRVDRLRSLGNAVVPQVAEWIGHRLADLG
jgi:DNA (cytosine-5)-methyltransferase 1